MRLRTTVRHVFPINQERTITSMIGARIATQVKIEQGELIGDWVHVGTDPERYLREVSRLQNAYLCNATIEVD